MTREEFGLAVRELPDSKRKAMLSGIQEGKNY